MAVPEAIPAGLEILARRAYERGRIASALRRSVWLLPLAALPLLGCVHPVAPLACVLCLVTAVTLFLWRGRGWRVGVWPGLLSGAAPLAIPFAGHASAAHCSPSGCSPDATLCVLAGMAGGFALGLLAPGPARDGEAAGGAPHGRGASLLAAVVTAGLAGSVGCGLYGLMGVAGMILGLAAGAAPVLALRHAQS